jgi:hypothetical protein
VELETENKEQKEEIEVLVKENENYCAFRI